ncbi:12434_t:CDS:2 [Entrophospora sp. SA101]|nr:12434_t:CDS:2 [Entrophospora sp. SA101]
MAAVCIYAWSFMIQIFLSNNFMLWYFAKQLSILANESVGASEPGDLSSCLKSEYKSKQFEIVNNPINANGDKRNSEKLLSDQQEKTLQLTRYERVKYFHSDFDILLMIDNVAKMFPAG